MPKFRSASAVKWRTSSGSETSGRRLAPSGAPAPRRPRRQEARSSAACPHGDRASTSRRSASRCHLREHGVHLVDVSGGTALLGHLTAARRRGARSPARVRSRDERHALGPRGRRPPRSVRPRDSPNVACSGNTSGSPSFSSCALAEAHAGLPSSRKPCGPSQDRYEAGERQQRLVRRDVRIAFSRRVCCSRVCRVRT